MPQFKESCRNCVNADTKCKPSHMAAICQKCGIGITPSMMEVIEVIGCKSYNYDGKGITDLERSYHKNKVD